jgi:hypothetical protein
MAVDMLKKPLGYRIKRVVQVKDPAINLVKSARSDIYRGGIGRFIMHGRNLDREAGRFNGKASSPGQGIVKGFPLRSIV